jgi:addiction module RelB/DinJ family antitoxin
VTTLHIRTEAKLKREVKKILAALGLDLSTAVNMFLREIVRCKGLPLPLAALHGFTPEQEEAIMRVVANAKRRHRQRRAAAVVRHDRRRQASPRRPSRAS